MRYLLTLLHSFKRLCKAAEGRQAEVGSGLLMINSLGMYYELKKNLVTLFFW